MARDVSEVFESFRNGEIVILVQPSPAPRGFLVCAAERTTPTVINQMITHGRGLVCVAITRARATELNLPLMVTQTSSRGTLFTVSVDGIETTTGISAYERAMTVRALLDPSTTKRDFRMPGHIFPLIGRDMGLLEREHYVEASIDLALLSGLRPMAVFVEVLDDEGRTASVAYLEELSRKMGFKMISVPEIKDFRIRHENIAVPVRKDEIAYGGRRYNVWQYRHRWYAEKFYLAVCPTDVTPSVENVLTVRECAMADLFGESPSCRCGIHFRDALKSIENGPKWILYERNVPLEFAAPENGQRADADRAIVVVSILNDMRKRDTIPWTRSKEA